MLVIGDNVFVGAGGRLIGETIIGDHVFTGVNGIVTRDVRAGSPVRIAGVEVTPTRSAPLP